MKVSDIYSLPMVNDEDCIMDGACRYQIDFDVSDSNCLSQIDVVTRAINNHDAMYAMLDEILAMQKQWYGYGMDTHMKLANLAKKIEPLLAKARGEHV